MADTARALASTSLTRPRVCALTLLHKQLAHAADTWRVPQATPATPESDPADAPDVLTWFELHTAAAPPCPVANWSHVDNGKVDRIRVAFEPRPLLR
jgi:hypothetical protein